MSRGNRLHHLTEADGSMRRTAKGLSAGPNNYWNPSPKNFRTASPTIYRTNPKNCRTLHLHWSRLI